MCFSLLSQLDLAYEEFINKRFSATDVDELRLNNKLFRYIKVLWNRRAIYTVYISEAILRDFSDKVQNSLAYQTPQHPLLTLFMKVPTFI